RCQGTRRADRGDRRPRSAPRATAWTAGRAWRRPGVSDTPDPFHASCDRALPVPRGRRRPGRRDDRHAGGGTMAADAEIGYSSMVAPGRRSFTIRAGYPATSTSFGTDLVITAPGRMFTRLPTFAPSTIAIGEMNTSSPIVGWWPGRPSPIVTP